MSQHTPLRLPESMTRVDIGPYMRGLREHFGLSQQDVSERLHIRHRYINAIENNAFDQMPGRAYAKGYVHTYAEFLGLDADQTVEISFGPEQVCEQHFVPEPMKRGSGKLPGQWRSVAVAAVIIALGILTVAQFTTGDNAGRDNGSVAEVPEEMLAGMRRLLMPSAGNYDCLLAGTPLGCIYEARDWERMLAITQPQPIYLGEAAYGRPLTAEEADAKDAPAAKVPKPAVEKPVAKKAPAKKPVVGIVPNAKPEGTKPLEEKSKLAAEKPKPDTGDDE